MVIGCASRLTCPSSRSEGERRMTHYVIHTAIRNEPPVSEWYKANRKAAWKEALSSRLNSLVTEALKAAQVPPNVIDLQDHRETQIVISVTDKEGSAELAESLAAQILAARTAGGSEEPALKLAIGLTSG